MPPYLPLVSVSRSQNIRLGQGPGNAVPTMTLDNPYPFYADLGVSEVRRDLQHHVAVGAILVVGAISLTVSSDYYISSPILVSAYSPPAEPFGSPPGAPTYIQNSTGAM